MPWTDRWVANGDVRLAVRDHGGDGPPLLLVHGHLGNLGSFDDFAPRLTSAYRVVAYDQRGHGWSDSGPTTAEAYVEDLAAVVAALDLDRPVLYGGSFGSLISLAAIHCGAVDARAFVNEDGWIDDREPPPDDAPRPTGRRIVAPEQAEMVRDGFAAFGATGLATYERCCLQLPDGSIELRPTQTELTEKAHAVGPTPVAETYRTLAAPVLLLAAVPTDGAEADQKRAAVDALVERAGGPVEVRWFETDHWITAIDPEGAAAALKDFATRL